MNNEDLVLKMILDESGFASGLNSAVKKLGDFDGKVDSTSQKGGRSLGSIWTTFAGNFLASGATRIISKGIGMITSNIDGAINRVDTLNNANRVFENMGFSAGETSKTMDSLKNSIQGLPTPLDSAIKGVQLIASSTNDLGKSEQIFAALNNGILGFGGSAEMVDNAIVQLSQSFSNGKVDAQTWNSMINSGLGPALNALAKQMGLTAGELKEGLSSGSISVSEFQDSLIKLNKEGGGGLKSLEQIAKDSTAGIKTGLANMKTAIVRGVANVVTKFDEGLKSAGFASISEIIAKQGEKFESMLTNFANALPAVIKTVKQLYDTVEPFIPLIIGLTGYLTTFAAVLKVQNTINAITGAYKSWKTATEGVTIAQKILNTVMKANWIAIIISAIVGLVVYIGYLWKTNEDFRNGVLKLWDDIKKAFVNTADAVVKAWDSTMKWFSSMWKGITDASGQAVENVKSTWSNTKQWFSDLWQGTKNTAVGVWDSVVKSANSAVEGVKNAWANTKQWFVDLWAGIVETVSNLVEGIMKYIGPLVYGVRNAFMHMGLFVSNLWGNLVNIAKNVFTILKNVIMAPMLFVTSLISDGWDEAKNNMIAVWENIAEAAGSIWGSITDIISNLFLNTKMAGLNLWYGLKNSFITIWTELSARAVEIWEGIKSYFSTLWENIKENAAQMWSDTKNNIVQSWETMKQSASDIWEAVKLFFVNTWKSILDGAVSTWNNIKNVTIETWESIKQFFKDTVNNIVSTAQGAWEGLKQGVRNAIDAVKNIFDEMKNIDLFEIGKNIIQGLIDGIGEMIGKVGKKVQEIAGSIKDTIKGALRINSPSRWMRDMIGKNIPLGIVRGIEQEQSTLDNAVDKMTDLPTEIPSIKLQTDAVTGSASKSIENFSDQVSQNGSGDTYNITLQAVGDLPEAQLMKLAKQFVTAIEVVRQNDSAAQGGVFNGI